MTTEEQMQAEIKQHIGRVKDLDQAINTNEKMHIAADFPKAFHPSPHLLLLFKC